MYEDILTTDKNHADALHLLGVIYIQTNNPQPALELIDRAIAIMPGNAAFICNRATALKELKKYEAAVASYDAAIAIQPDYADAHFNRGDALQKLDRLQAALDSYDCAIRINPHFAVAHFCRGNVLQKLGLFDAAVASYDCAIRIKPDYVDAYFNRGLVLRELVQLEAAIESYDRAIAVQPNHAHAWLNRGNAQMDLQQIELAIVSYEHAVALKPDFEYLPGMLFHLRMKLCDWTGFNENLAALLAGIASNEKVCVGFPVLSLVESPALQRKVAQLWINDQYPTNRSLEEAPSKKKSEKIRVGYFSADFRFHPVSILLAGSIELHNRDQFELIAFSFGPPSEHLLRKRLEAAFDEFIDIRKQSDEEVALLARAMNIDIAVDLSGATAGARVGIFARRAAPIQVCYLGYLGTMGADYFDYLIADKVIVPAAAQQHYSEKIVYLPSFQANDSTRLISDRIFTKQELGLPDDSFVFCCFNNNYKILPAVFDGWMRILQAVENSVLLLYLDYPTAQLNLKKQAQARGVDPSRLIFGEHLQARDYLARYRIADLFLDTFPYNAGTTASDALWAGLPLLTLAGETFASRVAASVLTAIDLPELITHKQADYEALAIALATHPATLKNIKAKLAANRLTTPLFNTMAFTRTIENAFTQMHERYHAGLKPDHIHVDPC